MASRGSEVVMEKETLRAAKSRQKLKHDEKIRHVKEILNAGDYHCGRGMYSRSMDIEFFLGPPGSVVVIALCNDKSIHHADIWVPLDYCDRTDKTLDSLRKAGLLIRNIAAQISSPDTKCK
jgi:hypothetical protein